MVFVYENNFFASFSKVSARQAAEDIAGRAKSFGVTAKKVNGNDVIEVYNTTKEAVKRANEGKGPTLIEATTYRFKGHCGCDDDIDPKLRTQEELKCWKEKCPILHLKQYLLEKNILTEQQDKQMKQKLQKEINDAVEFGRKSPLPGEEELLKDVFK